MMRRLSGVVVILVGISIAWGFFHAPQEIAVQPDIAVPPNLNWRREDVTLRVQAAESRSPAESLYMDQLDEREPNAIDPKNRPQVRAHPSLDNVVAPPSLSGSFESIGNTVESFAAKPLVDLGAGIANGTLESGDESSLLTMPSDQSPQPTAKRQGGFRVDALGRGGTSNDTGPIDSQPSSHTSVGVQEVQKEPAANGVEGPQTARASTRSGDSGTTVASSTRRETRRMMIRHSLQPDDTLRDLAKRFLGSEELWDEIYSVNRDVLKDPADLPAGVQITIVRERE